MTLALAAMLVGLILLVWSADLFVTGASSTAKRFGMPPLLIGMVVVGFGTSAPEMVVSALASMQGNSGIALGNAYGSNITNIALILGVTALISPIMVQSRVLKRELPFLIGVTLLAAWQLYDGLLSRFDAVVLLSVFTVYMVWTIKTGKSDSNDSFGQEMANELDGSSTLSPKKGFALLGIGLLILILSSRILVWGAVEIAHIFGVPDLIIGLTIVALGTSLPEFASSIIAARKGEHDIALGNIIGSNLFNTLAVVGIAGIVRPATVMAELLTRDVLVMTLVTLCLVVMGYGFRKQGRINRWEGAILLGVYIAYTLYLIQSSLT
jgi:cation:H+ antiporter